MKVIPVILCGGAGTRLWPKSKKNLPKQFIDWGGWTLFGKTLERIKSSTFDYPIISTNHTYLELIKKFLNKYKINKYKIILEPLKKNTAPAILSSALIEDIPYNQSMVFFSSDNLIGKVNEFNKSINFYKDYLNENNIFVFGIKPIAPSKEYGYFLTRQVSKKRNKVIKFIEKPNEKKLKSILKKKGLMNSGMFFMRKDSIIRNFRRHQYKMLINCFNSVHKAKIKKNVYYLKKTFFRKIKDISFDYAILEKSNDINGIKLNLPLTDLGNWKEIWKYFKKNNSKNNIKRNTFYRPWGKYINLFYGKNFLLKELTINSKSSISLQKHKFRSERWTVLEGRPRITINNKKFYKKANDVIFIPKGSIHRIENLYNKSVKIIEVQTGPILKETDIIRYKDVYGRIK